MGIEAKFGFIVEYVQDLAAAKQFYQEVLGLEVQRAHESYVQFETFAIASDEPMGGEAEHELYWLVDSAEAALEGLAEGVELALPLRQLPFGKVFGVRAPDGRPRYLLELAKDRPSRKPS